MTTATAGKTSIEINIGPIVKFSNVQSCSHSILLANYATTSGLVCATLN